MMILLPSRRQQPRRGMMGTFSLLLSTLLLLLMTMSPSASASYDDSAAAALAFKTYMRGSSDTSTAAATTTTTTTTSSGSISSTPSDATSTTSSNTSPLALHVELDGHDLPLRILKNDDDDDDDDRDNKNKNNDDDDDDEEDEEDEDEIPDDEYHCDDPEEVADEFRRDWTVVCDPQTYLWDISALNQNKIPKHCKDWDWEWKGSVEKLKDWEEPCYLWSIIYGDLTPPEEKPETIAPATSHPSFAPTTTPSTTSPTTTDNPPSATPTATPTTEETIIATTELEDEDEDDDKDEDDDEDEKQNKQDDEDDDDDEEEEEEEEEDDEWEEKEEDQQDDEKEKEEELVVEEEEKDEEGEEHHLEHEYQPLQQTVTEEKEVDSSVTDTVLPTQAPTTTTPTTPTELEQQQEDVDNGPKIYEISTMVMTYLMNPVLSNRRQRRALRPTRTRVLSATSSTSSTSTGTRVLSATSSSSSSTSSTSASTTGDLSVNREILQHVTTRHVKREMKRSLTFWLEQQELGLLEQISSKNNNNNQEGQQEQVQVVQPLQIGVDLTLTSVRSFLLPNETLVVTEALSGEVIVHYHHHNNNKDNRAPNFEWPTTIEPQIKAAFEGNALNRYVKELHTSNDPILQTTSYIEVGLPLDLLGGVPVAANNHGNDNIYGDPSLAGGNAGPVTNATVWTIAGVEFSLTTLAIIAGSIAIFSILLLLCVCWKLRSLRKQHLLEIEQETTTKPSHSTEESSTKAPSKKSKKRNSGRTPKKRGGNNDDNVSVASSEQIDESDPMNNRYYQRYNAETDDRSLATSTYSYLDSNLHGGAGGISLAPSFLYGNDDDQSKTMWSLIDGITNDVYNQDEEASYNYHQTASPALIGGTRGSGAGAGGGDNNDSSFNHHPGAIGTAADGVCTPERNLISPSNMMITTEGTKAPFEGEDDNLSLTSLGVGMSYQERITLAKTGAALASSSGPTSSTNTTGDDKEEQAPTAQKDGTTPTSQENTPTNPFAKENEARTAGRLGVSARKKKNSFGSSTGGGSGRLSNGSGGGGASSSASTSVRKAMSQLNGCTTSARDKEEQLEGDLLPAPSDERLEETPSQEGAAVLKENSYRGSTGSRKAGDNSTLKDVNQRLCTMGDSTINSKNSSLLPDKLFPDDTLDSSKNSSSVNLSKAISAATGTLMKDDAGNYIIDTMSSF